MRYSHGGDIYTYGEVVDFSVNVNPLGMSEHVAEAAKRGIEKAGAYPDCQCRELRKKLARRQGLPVLCIRKRSGRNFLYAGTGGKAEAGSSSRAGFFRV